MLSLPSVVLKLYTVDQEYYEKNILHLNFRKLYRDSIELQEKIIQDILR